jgi:hypothetical protein
MRNLAKIFVIVTACLVMADVAAAVNLEMPFVSVSLPRTPIYVGDLYGPGLKRVGAEFKAHVVANCPYHVEASFQGFRHQGGAVTISAKHLTVAINGKEVPVGTGRVSIAESSKPTSSGGVDVPVDLQLGVTGLASYPAGRYTGALVITVMARP